MAWALVGIAVLSVISFRLLSMVRGVFPPLVLALAFIFLLNPVVSALERRRVPRLWGTLAAYLLFLSFLFVAGLLLIPSVAGQIQDLVARLPELGQRTTRWASGLAGRFGVDLQAGADDLFKRFGGELSGLGRQIANFTRSALHVVVIFVLAPIFALYLLIDLPRLQRSFVEHLPAKHRDEWCMLLERCGQAVGGFFR
ncbi:MAG: AI-2E family transporter, partial [Actinomycetota bacterium]